MCPFHCIYVLHTNSNPLTSKIKHTFAMFTSFFLFRFFFFRIFSDIIFDYIIQTNYIEIIYWGLIGIMKMILCVSSYFLVIWWALILNNIVEIKLPIASNYINSIHCSNKANDFCFFIFIQSNSCSLLCSCVCFCFVFLIFFCFDKFVIWF